MSKQVQMKKSQTEIGDIPEGWELLRFEDIAQLRKEAYFPSEDEILPYIGLEHINQEALSLNGIGSSSETISNKFRFYENDILFGKLRPYFRKVYKAQLSGICSTDIWVLRSKENSDSDFLFYFVANRDFVNLATSGSTGTRMPRANWNQIKKTSWAIPEISEQQTIASILSSLDDKIELNRKMNKTLEEMGKALFKRWFVDFEFPDENSKPYKSAGGEMVESELGMIPRGWEVIKLRNVVQYYIGGGWGKEEKDKTFNTPAYVIRGTDIPQIEQGDVSTVPLRFHKASNFESRELNFLDIIIEVSGGSKRQPVGRTTLVNKSLIEMFENKSICASFCKLIRINNKIFNSYLAYWKIKLLYETDDIYRYQEQSTGISNFKFEYFLDDLKILKPTRGVNEKSRILFENLHDQITKNGEENRILSRIRDELLPRLMSGRLRV